MRVRVIVVPVFKREWLYYADAELPAEATAITAADWDKVQAPSEKLCLLGQCMKQRVIGTAKSQWHALQLAPTGTLKHRIFQLAQHVLAREDPTETFLKSIPKDTLHVEIIYPASLKEALVRRRLRMLCAQGAVQHRRNALGWSVATLPQLPLMITPFPNVTLYYSAYRLISNWQASQGASAMLRAFDKLDAVQMHHTLQSEADLRRHLKQRPELLKCQVAVSEDEHHQRSRQSRGHPLALMPAPTFVGSQQLDDIVQPLERWKTPLSDEVARQLGYKFSCVDLIGQVARMRQRAAPGVAALA